MTSAANVPASKVTGSNQPGATFAVRSTASQRWLTMGAAKRTDADSHEAAVGSRDRRWPERRL